MENNAQLSDKELLEKYIEQGKTVGLVEGAEVMRGNQHLILKRFKLSENPGENGRKDLLAVCVFKDHEAAGETELYADELYAKSFMAAQMRKMITQTLEAAVDEAKKAGFNAAQTEELMMHQISKFGFMANGKVRTEDGTKRKIAGFRFADDTIYVSSSINGNDSLGTLDHDIKTLIPVRSLVQEPVQTIRISMSCDECENGNMRFRQAASEQTFLHQCDNEQCRRTETYNRKFPYISYQPVNQQ